MNCSCFVCLTDRQVKTKRDWLVYMQRQWRESITCHVDRLISLDTTRNRLIFHWSYSASSPSTAHRHSSSSRNERAREKKNCEMQSRQWLPAIDWSMISTRESKVFVVDSFLFACSFRVISVSYKSQCLRRTRNISLAVDHRSKRLTTRVDMSPDQSSSIFLVLCRAQNETDDNDCYQLSVSQLIVFRTRSLFIEHIHHHAYPSY